MATSTSPGRLLVLVRLVLWLLLESLAGLEQAKIVLVEKVLGGSAQLAKEMVMAECHV